MTQQDFPRLQGERGRFSGTRQLVGLRVVGAVNPSSCGRPACLAHWVNLGMLEMEKYAMFLSFHPPEWRAALPFNGLRFLLKVKHHTLRLGSLSALASGLGLGGDRVVMLPAAQGEFHRLWCTEGLFQKVLGKSSCHSLVATTVAAAHAYHPGPELPLSFLISQTNPSAYRNDLS